uniref:Uncharacterized protein n=1 Tax=Rhodosorus marinus TaxID=101924 RepID=A0A7S3E6J1_9RHOD|mmetsp:Transcript_10013/g.42193  ORF Transcript_10013/g.42193 Transcript_10013/m.42193 type:complete len:350 (+) Transcript_10013:314-1363(+)
MGENLDWESEVLHSFQQTSLNAGTQKENKDFNINAVSTSLASVKLSGERRAESVQLTGRQLERLIVKVLDDLKAYRSSTEASLKLSAQAQNHFHRLYSAANLHLSDEVPPTFRSSQRELTYAVRNMFESRFDERIWEAMTLLHRRIQILLEGNASFRKVKAGSLEKRFAFSSLLGVSSQNDADQKDAENSENDLERKQKAMYEAELVEIRKTIISTVPQIVDALKELQIGMYSTAVRHLSDVCTEAAGNLGDELDMQSTGSSVVPELYRLKRAPPSEAGFSCMSADPTTADDYRRALLKSEDKTIKEKTPSQEKPNPTAQLFEEHGKIFIGVLVGLCGNIIRRKLFSSR